jgi:hypothetical protein
MISPPRLGVSARSCISGLARTALDYPLIRCLKHKLKASAPSLTPWQLLDQLARIQKGRSLVQAACRRLHLPGTHHSARTAPNVWALQQN